MAPFNTHFLIAEKIWPELDALWQPHFGQFCFGCIAPDVDKVSATLTQKDTHFFDRTGDYEFMATHRTTTFLRSQAGFLSRPFTRLAAEAQAFVLGYLCHLSVDEVSKHLWRQEVWLRFKQIKAGAAFAALDEAVRQYIQDYPALAEAICSIQVLDDVIPRIPSTDLEWMRQGTCTFVQAKSVEEEFLALVDLFDRPTPEKRQQQRQDFRAEIDLARRQVAYFRIETLINAGLIHSRQRLADLVEGRVPEPDYPLLAE